MKAMEEKNATYMQETMNLEEVGSVFYISPRILNIAAHYF